MKLSVTNCLNSSLSAMGCHPAFEVIYELADQKLRGDDADQSHIVLDADGGALLKFCLEHRHRGRIENAVAPNLLGGKEGLYVLARGRLEKTAGFRRSIGLLMALDNRWWNETGRTAFQEVLFIQHFHFQRDWQPGGKFDYPMVQEGEPAFDGVCHGHAVALRRQDVAGKQVLRLEVLGLAETVPGSVRLGQPRSDFGMTCVSVNFSTDGIGEESLQVGCQLPARNVREEWLEIAVDMDVEECFAVGVGLVLNVLQVGIQPAKQKRPHPGIGLRFPEAANLGFFENVVAAEHFVGPFSGYHYLVAALAHQPRQKIERSWSRAQDRFFGVPDHVRKYFGDLILGAADVLVLAVQKAYRLLLEGAFIEFGVVKRDREGPKLGVRKLLDQCRGNSRVQPAAEVSAYRDIRA